MPYYVSNFLMHIQPCIIVECMLQTPFWQKLPFTQQQYWEIAVSKMPLLLYLLINYFSLNEIFKLDFSMYSVWNFMALFVRTCEYVFSDSIICFS